MGSKIRRTNSLLRAAMVCCCPAALLDPAQWVWTHGGETGGEDGPQRVWKEWNRASVWLLAKRYPDHWLQHQSVVNFLQPIFSCLYPFLNCPPLLSVLSDELPDKGGNSFDRQSGRDWSSGMKKSPKPCLQGRALGPQQCH